MLKYPYVDKSLCIDNNQISIYDYRDMKSCLVLGIDRGFMTFVQ